MHFDCIWASPPCTEYSIARTTAKTPRNLELADDNARRTEEIIAYLQPRTWWVENPWTGMLRKREVAASFPPPCLVSYRMRYRLYRKDTALWTNVPSTGLHCDRSC